MDGRRINQELQTLIRKRFNLIYKAAKDKNDQLIKMIIKASYQFKSPYDNVREVNSLSIKVNMYTPISLLAFEGDHDSVNFLLAYGADEVEAAIGYLAVGDNFHADMISDDFNEIDHNNIAYNVAILKVKTYNETLKRLKDECIINAHDNLPTVITKIINIQGNIRGLTSLGISKDLILKLLQETIGFEHLVKETLLEGYAYGNHDLDVEINQLPYSDKCTIAYGYASAGNLEAILHLDKAFSYMQKFIMSKYTFRGFYQSGYMHDPDILVYICANLKNNNYLQNRAGRLLKANTCTTFSLKSEVEHFKYLENTYNINRDQITALFQINNLIWILQGVQLVKQGILSMDIYIKILSFSCNLTEFESAEIYSKVSFKYLKDFIIADVEKYTNRVANVVQHYFAEMISWFDSTYKKSPEHYNIANSFLNSCKESTNLGAVKNLISNQFCLFSSKDNQSALNENNDAFQKTIQRHHQRIVGRY